MNYEGYVKELLSVLEDTRKINHKHFHNSDNKSPITLSEGIMVCCINDYVSNQKKNNKQIIGIKSTELSKILKTTKPATSKMLNNLEEKGFIERINNKEDRRAVYINVTNRGIEALQKHKERNIQIMTKVLERMPEEDIINIIKLMKKMNCIMEEVYNDNTK